MSLSDLSIEILNEAKLATDPKDKLYKLEQIKEIVFHRDVSILAHIIPEMQVFMLEKSIAIRRFLLQFILDACGRNEKNIDILINLCFFFVHDDNLSENLLKSIANAFMRMYGQIAVYLSKLSTTVNNTVKTAWNNFQTTSHQLLELLASNTTDAARLLLLRFAEEYLLFGLPQPPISLDPRKMKHVQKANIINIPAHHSFINPKQMEQDADLNFNKFLLWGSKNGPQGFSFSPNLMGQLISTICNVSAQRPTKLQFSMKAVNLFLKDKSSICQAMEHDSKDHMLHALQRLVHAAGTNSRSSTGISDVLLKLQGHIKTVEIPSFHESSKDTLLLRKRSLSTDSAPSVILDDDDEVEAKVDLDDVRATVAAAAVDQAERDRKSQRSNIASIAGLSSAASLAPDIELCADLALLPNLFSKEQLIGVSFYGGEGVFTKAEALVTAIPKPGTVHDDISFQSLRRLLDGYMRANPLLVDAQLSLRKVCVRATLLQAYADIQAERTAVKVSLFNAPLSSSHSRDDLPTEVEMPRAVWLLLSYCLLRIDAEQNVRGGKVNRKIQVDAVNLVIALFNEVFERAKQSGMSTGDGTEGVYKLYDSAVLAAVARCIDRRSLRWYLKQLLLGLPRIPRSCVYLLGMMATRPAAPDHPEKSYVKDLFALLCEISLSAQSAVSRENALKTLLWFCVADEFDVRIKAITFLTKELLDKSEAITGTVIEFAKHAVISILGADNILRREKELIAASIAGKPQEVPTVVERAEGVADDNDRKMEVDDNDDEDREDKDGGKDDTALGKPEKESLESVYDCARRFDNGRSFGGSFSVLSVGESNEKVESLLKRHIQLFMQAALTHSELLLFIWEVYAVNESVRRLAAGEKAAAGEGEEEEVTPERTKAEMIKRLLTTEVAHIVPVVLQSRTAEELFDQLTASSSSGLGSRSEQDIDLDSLLARELTVEVLGVLFKEDRIPPPSSLVGKVRAFAATLPSEGERQRALCCVIGGLTATEVEALILTLLRTVSLEELDKVFSKIYRARPPPISKAALLIFLHRVDIETYDQKIVLDSIELCLRNKSEFRSEAIKECVNDLLKDDIPVLPLMRTAIRSAQAFPDLRPFVLNEVVPKVIQKRV